MKHAPQNRYMSLIGKPYDPRHMLDKVDTIENNVAALAIGSLGALHQLDNAPLTLAALAIGIACGQILMSTTQKSFILPNFEGKYFDKNLDNNTPPTSPNDKQHALMASLACVGATLIGNAFTIGESSSIVLNALNIINTAETNISAPVAAFGGGILMGVSTKSLASAYRFGQVARGKWAIIKEPPKIRKTESKSLKSKFMDSVKGILPSPTPEGAKRATITAQPQP